jgi:HTH-type transcriptional regulator, cell division transcriptional repressor
MEKDYFFVRNVLQGLKMLEQSGQKNDDRSTPTAKGKRLKRLRNLANLSRQDLEKTHELNYSTYKGWEIGRAGGLSRKGAKKMIGLVRAEGVICDINWLLYGIGTGPIIREKFSVHESQAEYQIITPAKEEKQIIAELQFFRQEQNDTIDMIVADNSMEPFYAKGEYIAGIKRYKKHIDSTIGCDCITQTADGQILLRQVRKSKTQGCYTLACLNPQAIIEEPVLYDIELISAAPVIWRRRKNPPH